MFSRRTEFLVCTPGTQQQSTPLRRPITTGRQRRIELLNYYFVVANRRPQRQS
jgi:hypothetical protein